MTARARLQSSFGRRLEETVQENLGWSGENRLAVEGELEASRRSLSQPEVDRSAKVKKAARIEAKSVWENWSSVKTS